MGALIGAGIGAVGSIASGVIGSQGKAKAYQQQKSIINQSVIKQAQHIRLGYARAEPLVQGQLRDARVSRARALNSLGGAQDITARVAQQGAQKQQDALDTRSLGAGLEFSGALDSAKRAIGGDVNRSLLGLEMALAGTQAQVEGAANANVGAAAGSVANLAIGKSQAQNQLQQAKLALLANLGPPPQSAAPDFAGLAAGLFGTPTSGQLNAGLLPSLWKSFFPGGESGGGGGSGFASGWGGYIPPYKG